MTIGIFGRRGHGKSQLQTLLGLLFKERTGLPLRSNCQIVGSQPVTMKELLSQVEDSIVCLDEFWQKMDSRNFKDKGQMMITHWYQMQRHLNIMLIYTTQLLSQIDKRIRESTDYFIYCERRKKEGIQQFKYIILDGFTMQPIKILKTDETKIKWIWKYYNHISYTDTL